MLENSIKIKTRSYTCIATNKAAAVNFTAQLIVRGALLCLFAFFNQLLCLFDFSISRFVYLFFFISCFVYMYAFLISCFDYFELFAFINQLFSIIQQAGRGCFIQCTNLTLFVPAVNINLTLTDFQNSLNISMYVYHFVINVGRRNID